MTLEEARQLYLDDLKVRHYSPLTLRLRQSLLKGWIEMLAARSVCYVQDIKREDVLAYLATFRERSLTIKTTAMVLRSFLRWLCREGHHSKDLAGVIPEIKTRYQVTEKILTEAEVEMFLQLPDVRSPKGLRDRVMLEVLYSSALRVSELVRLDVYDVQEMKGALFIRQAKGKKDRIVPVGRVALRWLKHYLSEVRKYYAAAGEAALFVSVYSGRRLRKKSIIGIIRKYDRRSGLDKTVSAHVFRHSCATHLLKAGCDIRYVQELLGHSSIHTTEIYTHLDITDLKKAIARCHPRKNLLIRKE